MARWVGHADATKEGTGGGGFTPAPRGFYTIQVADFKDGVSQKSNRPTVNLECEITDQGPFFGKKVWLTVTQIPEGEKGHGIMLHTFHAFGLEFSDSYDFDTASFQGRQARVLLGTTTRTKVVDGRTYHNEVNFVEELYTEKHPEPKDGKFPPAKGENTVKQEVPAAVKAAFPGAKVKEEQLSF